MANGPDNLVLVQLREIRATQTEHSARFDRIDKRLDQMDKRFEDFHALTNHTLSVSTTSYLKSQEVERRQEFDEGEQRRLSERMDEFERRLSDLEEKDKR